MREYGSMIVLKKHEFRRKGGTCMHGAQEAGVLEMGKVKK